MKSITLSMEVAVFGKHTIMVEKIHQVFANCSEVLAI